MAILPPGTELAGGRFLVKVHLGSGAQAHVYDVLDRHANTRRCLKVFAIDRSDPDHDALWERFVLTSQARIGDPRVVDAIELIEEGDFLAALFPLIEGRDLGAYLERAGGRIEPAAAASIDLELLRAGFALQRAGVVHRDLKPLNVLITDRGEIRVIDLGAAVLPGETPGRRFVGTVPWCAPEQVSDPSGVGPAADFYALGLIAWTLHTGANPFHRPDKETFLEAARAGIAEPPSHPDENVDLSMRLARARLAFDPSERIARVHAVLRRAASPEDHAARCCACRAPATSGARCEGCGGAFASPAVSLGVNSDIAGEHTFLVPEGETSFGRTSLPTADPYVSRRQFDLRNTAGVVAVRNTARSNPTRVDGSVPTEWVTLNGTHEIRFGSCVARIGTWTT
jgi:hypothetical protein